MIKKVLKLVKPGVFLPFFEEAVYDETKVLVRPLYLSICAADRRYFQGNRPAEVLAKKLPMALFHEATGIVLNDPQNIYEKGQNVVLLPGDFTIDDNISNYREHAFFRSSNDDGFTQETMLLNHKDIIPIPSKNRHLYVYTELLSVCCHALRRLESRVEIQSGQSVGIWGDGIMGFMMALTLHTFSPHLQLHIFGKHDEKLQLFSFAHNKINIMHCHKKILIDYAFECVGGNSASKAIEHIITMIKPCGHMVLMGVSEIAPTVNTRIILEKGLSLFGSSRSQRQDFEKALKIFEDKDNMATLELITNNFPDVTKAFELKNFFQHTLGTHHLKNISKLRI